MNLSVPPDRLPVCQFGRSASPPRAAPTFTCASDMATEVTAPAHTQGRRPDASGMSAVASARTGCLPPRPVGRLQVASDSMYRTKSNTHLRVVSFI